MSTALRLVRSSPVIALMWLGACGHPEPEPAPEPASTPEPSPSVAPEPAPTPASEAPPAAEAAPTPSPAQDVAPAPPPPRPVPEIRSESVKGKTTHRLALDLRPDDLLEPAAIMERELAYHYSDGGQFEIYVPASLLPVSAPGCESGVIVRMPWTNPEARGAEAAMEGKRTLFVALEELRARNTAEHRVFLELGPYVEGEPDEPGGLSLTRCTVFFRHEGEAEVYVDSLEPRR